MPSPFYSGRQVRPVTWQTYSDVVVAAAAGHLDETQWLELKELIHEHKSANLETARDLASLSVEGGFLVVGVQDAKGTAGSVIGTELGALADRLAQIAVNRIDPPLNIMTRTIADPDRDGYGVLVVTVPASVMAPHMVDGAYWGRSAQGKRKLSDGEVRLLHHESERRASRFIEDLRALPGALGSDLDAPRQLAHTHLLLRPAVNVGTAMADAVEAGGSFRTYVNQGLRFDPQHLPTLAHVQHSVPHPDGWELSNGSTEESQTLRAVLGADGSIAVFSGAASYADGPETYISPGSVIELTHSVVEVAGFIGESVLHHTGTWQLGLLVDGLAGLPSSLARSSTRTRHTTYPRDTVEHVIEATSDDLLHSTREVVGRLVRPFVRGMGAEFLLQYASPERIGTELYR